MTVLDLFAGPGGWDEGIRPLGIRPAGLELNADACVTGTAAGHRRIRTDVAALEPRTFGDVSGLIGSPPCQGFSMAGHGRGRDDSAHLLQALATVDSRAQLEDAMAGLHASMTDDKSLLALEPLRWVLALNPEWTAWEQVPTVQPLWDACAVVLRRNGWSVATGILNAEQYGVPQTRRRAFLVARHPSLVDWIGEADLPIPTHSRYHVRTPGRLDPDVLPWVTMRDALGIDGDAYLRSNYGTGGDPRKRGLRTLDQPAPTVTSKINRNHWIGLAGEETWTRRITLEDAALLQTFPGAYPWCGNASARWQQVGDAVPPLLARAVLSAVTGLEGTR